MEGQTMTTTAEIIASVGVVALVILWGQVLWLQRRINALDAHYNRLAERIWELHREALTTVTAHTQRLEEQIAELRSALPLAS
jgi:uncharacterized protein YPO0396